MSDNDRTRSRNRDRKAPVIIDVGEVPDVVATPSEVARSAVRRAAFDVKLEPAAIAEIVDLRAAALVEVHRTLDRLKGDLTDFFPQVPQTLPATLRGTLVNGDGSPAATVAVEADEPQFDEDPGAPVSWARPRAITDARGVFSLRLPHVPVPDSGLRLRVRGGNTTTSLVVARRDLLTSDLGVVDLDTTVSPLPRSVVARLGDLVPTDEDDAEENPEDFASPAPAVMLGEGDCARSFRSGQGIIDRFRYSVLIRLIDPLVAPKQLVLRRRVDGGGYVPIELERSLTRSYRSLDRGELLAWLGAEGEWRFTDRVPVDHPLDVAEFHDDVAETPRDVPKAGTLGLGYILHLRQTWVPAGLSLGNLLYSLPLAPGEEQRVAVFDQRETLSVRETERLDVAEFQRFQERADTSSAAVFRSAFDEAISGGSRVSSRSSSGGFGAAGGIGGLFGSVLAGIGIAGGYGSSSSSGSTSSWQNTSRDFVSSAAEEFHSYLGREAAARRSAARTSVRLATAGETETLTTKRIANHNHCHALTVQYWEVLRHYAIASRIEDVQLVCYVPLELIPWLPAGQARTLATGGHTRTSLLTRYGMLLRYADVLERYLARSPHRYGLRLLREFAADPRAGVEPASASSATVVKVRLQGTFLPFEDVYASLVTESGVRVGPFRMSGTSPTIPAETLETRDRLVADLRERRQSETGVTRQVDITLPRSVARSDIALLELSRRVRPFSYRLKESGIEDLLEAIGGAFSLAELRRLRDDDTVTLSPSDLEREVGGPQVWDVVAEVVATGETYVNVAAGRSAALTMGDRLPIPTTDLPPLLSFEDLLRIEETLQHVLGDPVFYSKAVWWSIDPDERAILLERYTIGVPEGGVVDPSQEVPLLNCVANRVLGFFGNAMVMPFHIPPSLAADVGYTSRDVQDALVRFHRQAFRAPTASVTLPTRGMLGEAVLGSCNSCERIDLTRFWNWQDSPIREADQPRQETFGQSVGLVGGAAATAPATLTPPPGSLINIAATDRPDGESLAAKLIAALPAGTDLGNITGLAQLQEIIKGDQSNANAARKEAVEQASTLAQKAMTELPNVLKQVADSKRADREAGEADEKAAKENAAAKRTSALKTLKDQAGDLIALAGAQPSDAAAGEWASALVATLLGDGQAALTPVEAAGLFGAYRIGGDDDAATRRGKTALLTALGLPVPTP